MHSIFHIPYSIFQIATCSHAMPKIRLPAGAMFSWSRSPFVFRRNKHTQNTHTPAPGHHDNKQPSLTCAPPKQPAPDPPASHQQKQITRDASRAFTQRKTPHKQSAQSQPKYKITQLFLSQADTAGHAIMQQPPAAPAPPPTIPDCQKYKQQA